MYMCAKLEHFAVVLLLQVTSLMSSLVARQIDTCSYNCIEILFLQINVN